MKSIAGWLAAAVLGLSCAVSQAADEIVHFRARAGFAETQENLLAAIEERGLVVNNVSHVGDMLERTGRDLGATRRIYEAADVIEFCSARLSREMMQADPRHLVYCPFTLAVYSLPGEQGAHVAYRRPPQRPGVEGVIRLLDDIARQAAGK